MSKILLEKYIANTQRELHKTYISFIYGKNKKLTNIEKVQLFLNRLKKGFIIKATNLFAKVVTNKKNLQTIKKLEQELGISIIMNNTFTKSLANNFYNYTIDKKGNIIALRLYSAGLENRHIPIINKLSKIKKLEVELNNITTLSGITLECLNTLDVSHNRIKIIDGEDTVWKNLITVSAYNNIIDTVQNMTKENIPNLSYIYLWKNKREDFTFPESVTVEY